MSERWSGIAYFVLLAVAWGICGFSIGYTGLFSESPDEAFVRGYFHGAYHAISVADGRFNQDGSLISSFREYLAQDSNALWQEWLEEIDRESSFDSTDTMPAVDPDTMVRGPWIKAETVVEGDSTMKWKRCLYPKEEINADL